MSRRQLLAAGASAAVASTVAPARAALPPATPVGDDVGFLAFAVVAEGVLTACFAAALRVGGAWTAGEKRLLGQAHDHHKANIARINAALGPDDAVSAGDFARQVRIGSRAGALRVGRELETLAGGAYLGGVAASADYGTRLLLGRLLALTSANHALLARWAGAPPAGLPARSTSTRPA